MSQKQLHPFWMLGFRPFFLLGAALAVAVICIWMFVISGKSLTTSFSAPYIWHAHEMIYGYALAITAGFLLTATQNWTGIRGVHGGKLMILVFVWLSARVLPLLPSEGNTLPLLASFVDLSFIPLLVFFLRPYLGIPEQKRNRIFFVCFLLLFGGNVLVHLDAHVSTLALAHQGNLLGLGAIILAVTIIAGRVLPFFTKSAVPNAKISSSPWVEKAIVPITVLWALGKAFDDGGIVASVAAFLAFVLHFKRWLGWHSWQARKNPILWILHVGYLWLVIGFALDALLYFRLFIPSLATHAYAVGCIGILTYGMISRVALGHSGRPIRADRFIVTGYILLNVAAIARVIVPILNPSLTYKATLTAGWLWVIAFTIFCLRYWPILTKPRIDGKVG